MKFVLAVVALFAFAGPALADDVITLELETPGFSNPEPKPRASDPKPNITTVTARATEKPIGKVALVTQEKAGIYAKQSAKSRVYSVCVKDTPLAVVTTSGSWYGVLMVDGSTGWIRTRDVKVLDYAVAAPTRLSSRKGNYTYRGTPDAREPGNAVVQTALQYLGVPYVYGGNSPASGIDCSAFVKMVFGQFGVNLPRTAREQSNVGAPVSWDDLRPGDRVYFACKHFYPDHCGIYMGNDYFVHASASHGGVAVSKLSSKFYSQSLAAVMR